ncbi:dihydrolipoamide dehydrogenase [Staphylococcus petrasii]|uniref:Dihydrolipoyl dehydrogenase n=2 Tax=Staphylococcus petrasii TaxID=1276936 RepID=A0A380FX45_9STAP|nr:dihydrolipoamide dehydrogenase [Staphylococcus petrasii]
MMSKSYDLIIIGAGPGGYAAAIRAAQLGKHVAIIEKKHVGGVCLNVGCIPAKLFLEYGAKVRDIHSANSWGIKTNNIDIDLTGLVQRKDQVVKTVTDDVRDALSQHKVDLIEGEAEVLEDLKVQVNETIYTAKDIILATGTKPFVPPIEGVDQAHYETADTFFNMKKLPKQLVIIGGGVIASEIASAMADLGVDVTILEKGDSILSSEIKEIREHLTSYLKQQGVNIITNSETKKINATTLEIDGKDGPREIPYETLLFATGRQPNVHVAKALQLEQDGKCLKVNEHYETSYNHVYAIGDLVPGYQLAHTASAHGKYVAEKIAGKNPDPIYQEDIPRCIYTRLESASVGLSEIQAKEAGYDVEVTTANFQKNPKAILKGETQGFIKIVANKQDGKILGGFIVGPHATDLISEILGVKASGGTLNDISQIIQPHPSLSEALGESADASFGKAIYI